MSRDAPKIVLPREIAAQLDAFRDGLAAETTHTLTSLARPCALLTSRRVSPAPLRRGALMRLFGAKTAAASLSVMSSKFGGTPYTEAGEDWSGWSFLCQLDLSAMTAPDGPLPEQKLRGIIRVDVATKSPDGPGGLLRAVHHPEASLERAVPALAVESVGSWECAIDARRSWSLPRDRENWFSRVPHEDLWDVFNELEVPGYDEDSRDEAHRLGGWRAGGLDEHYGFDAPEGCSDDITDYAQVLRITFDNVADFGWGSNWCYVLTPETDLERGGRLRLVTTAANS